MSEFEKNITFIIVSFRSDNVIQKCIESISPNCKVIVVENSQNTSIKKYLEKKFSNVRVLITGENLGYGRGNNLGISKVKTKYAFILNPDAYLEKNTLKELNNTKCILQEEFSILSPIICGNKKYYKSFNGKEKNFIEVDFVKGFAMLLNLEKIDFNEIFDKKIFLFLEEIDLCKRVRDLGGKIYAVNKCYIYHDGKKSSGNNLEIDKCRNWHWMWSLFFYNKKHYGNFVAYRVTIVKFFSSLIKFLFGYIFFKKNYSLIHKSRIEGLINAYYNKPSWRRPYE